MPKPTRMLCQIKSFGIYDAWDAENKQVPSVKQFTLDVPARIGVEFGYILKIKHGRGLELRFEIDHPPWLKADGSVEPPFVGSFYVRHNDFEFFLGDTIWEPWQEKLGSWRLRTWHQDLLLAEKTFNLHAPNISA